MAITPDSATALNADDIILLGRIQEAIDIEIRKQYVVGKTIIVRHSILKDLFEANGRVFDSLLHTYQNKNWNIVRYENKRQGPWLSLSEF